METQLTVSPITGSQEPSMPNPHTKANKLRELPHLRGRNTKHFLNSDGSLTAEVSIHSRHFKNAQGNWNEISNRLVNSDESGFGLRNEANQFEAHFARNSRVPYLFKIKVERNRSFSWGLENSNNVSALYDEESVAYSEILQGVDLRYTSFSDGIKEEITLKDISAPHTFRFTFQSAGLIPVIQPDGSVQLNDEKSGQTELILSKPFMMDSLGQMSEAISLTLEPTNNPNRYILELNAEEAWLKDPHRVYPVTIDPTVTTVNWYTPVTGSGADTYIASNNTLKYYANLFMTTGRDVNLGLTRAFVKFPLPTLPKGAIVTNGIFTLTKYTKTSTPSEDLIVARVTSDWDQKTIEWGSQPSFDQNEETRVVVKGIPGDYLGSINFNVWSIVKGWINGGLPNYGFMIAHNQESNPLFFYRSSEAASGNPFLSITYMKDSLGLNPYWSYANTPIGSVNTMNGNFISSVLDFSLPGRGVPINITRTYNSRGNLDGLFGKKWFSNLDMQLRVYSWGVVLVDSTGTERSFMLKSDGATYAAPDNYPMQLYRIAGDYYIQEAYTETSTFQAKLPYVRFSGSRVDTENGVQVPVKEVVELDDGKGNKTIVTWSDANVVLKDPSGRTVTLNRNPDKTVSQITTSVEAGKIKASYSYINGYLNNVTYDRSPAPNTTIYYEWQNGLLYSLTDKKGIPSYILSNSSNQVISVGTLNLIANPSFEASNGTNLDSWTLTVDNDAGNIQQFRPTSPLYGAHGLKITSLLKAGAVGWSYLYASQRVPVTPGKTYTLSAQISTSNLAGRAFIQIEQLNSTGGHISYHDTRLNASTGTSSWKMHRLEVTAAPSAAAFIVYMEIDHDSSRFGGEAYFDGAQLEVGSVANPIFQGHTDFRYGTESGYPTTWVTSPTGELFKYQTNNYGNPITIVEDPRDGNPVARTEFTWDAQDRLRTLTTPNLVGKTYSDGITPKRYEWTYDAVGNPLSAKELVEGRPTTKMTYYYNRLAELTQANNEKVRNIWDPVNLNLATTIDQTLNSKAFGYDTVGNVILESNLLGVADNRILNGDFSRVNANGQPDDWFAYIPSGATNRVIADADGPFGKSNILKISPNGNPYAYQWTDYITLGGVDQFSISGYMRTDQPGTTGGAGLNIYWFDVNKNQISISRLFNVRSQTWQRYVDTLLAPAGAVYARIAAITYGAYDGYFDMIQFEKSEMARGYNLIENSSFERGILSWTVSDSGAKVVSGTESSPYSGNYCAQINRASMGTSWLETEFSIPVTLNPDGNLQDYTLTGFIKTANVVSSQSNGGAWLHIFCYDAAGKYVNDFASKALIGDRGWTKVVRYIQPPVNTKTMKVRVELWNATGTAHFDNIRLSVGKLTIGNGYDDPNRNYLTGVTDQLGNTASKIPDAYGQTKTLTSPGGEVTNYVYNGQEQLTKVTDNAGNATDYTLDSNGNVTSVVTASAYNKTTFQYDVNDNLLQEENELGNVTRFGYDEGGRINRRNNPNGTSVSTDYDAYGNLRQVQLSGGPVYEFGYDLEGQRTGALMRNESGQIVSQWTHRYDEVGNLINTVEKNGTGQLIAEVTSPTGKKMYSDLNQLLGFDLKYGANTYTYSFSYTKSNLIKEIVATGKTFSLVYDESNNLTAVVNPDSTVDVNTYNEAHQVVQTQTIDSQNQPKWLSRYQYDQDGRLVKITGQGMGSPSADYVYNNATEKLNRLTRAIIRDGANTYTFNYSYDPAGNLLTMDTPQGNHTFSYDHWNGTKNDNRIYAINGSSAATGHDANGNLTKLVLNGITTYYVYDSANRLIQVKDNAGNVTVSYTYDGDGKRLTKTANGETITYHYFGGQLLYETSNLDPANTVRARYFWGQAGKMLGVLYYKRTLGYSNYYYFHYNALGDVIAVTDSWGNVQREYVYDPYGNIIKVRDGSGNPVDILTDVDFNHAYTYRGYRYDRETGLYYLNARYYHPGIGRFLTKDTWKGVATDPRSLNRYMYTAGDPVNLVDPSGNIPLQIGPFGYKSIQMLLSNPQYRENVRSSVGGGNKTSIVGQSRKSDEVSRQVNNANKLLLNTVGSIGDIKIEKLSKGIPKAILNRVGPLAVLGTGYDLLTDFASYEGYDRYQAAGLTLLGFGLTIGLTAIFLPVGATAVASFAVGTAFGVSIGFGIDWIKETTLKSTN